MSKHNLTALVDGAIWIVDRPVWFSGVRLRARTTIVRLADGGLLVYSPCPPTDALLEQLRSIGPVRWLVVPNCFHHLGTPAAAARFPDAKVVGPTSVIAKNKALKLDLEIHDARFAEQIPEFDVLPLEGVPFLDETVLFHRPTQTLLGADIVISANADDHWSWRWAARITGCYERMRVPPDVKHKIRDKDAAARSIRAMTQRAARRLVVAHAAVIEERPGERLAEAWRVEGVAV